MPTRILHKRNATPNTAPLAGDLTPGELAFNTADGKLYLKRDDNVIVDLTQSIFERDTTFTVVDDGVSPGTITGEIDGVQKLQINAAGITIDGSVDINSAETLYFNDADNSNYVGISAPDVVDYTYIFKLPETLPVDRGVLSITPDGQTSWGSVYPFDNFVIYVSEKEGNDANDGVHNPVLTIKRAAQLAARAGRIPTVDPGEGFYNARRLIEDNTRFLIDETIGYVNTTYGALSYDQNEWERELERAIEAVQFDIIMGGNEKAVAAGEATNGIITSQTEYTDALEHLRDITVNIIKNEDPVTSYQGLITQIKYPQLTDGSSETDIINDYNVIRDIITNDTSPAVVANDFTIFPVTIEVSGGDFVVDNPVVLAEKVSLQSANSRAAIFRPKNANVDMFRVRDGSSVISATFRDGLDGAGDPSFTFDWAFAFDDPADTSVDRLGYFASLESTVPTIEIPPLFQNVLTVSFLGANGLNVNGAKVLRDPSIPTPEPQRLIMRGVSFALSSYGGIGCLASNNGYAQLSTCAFSFCSNSLYAQSGGFIAATNSGTSFGINALRSSGFRSTSFPDDRGVVANTGTINGEQFLRIVGTKRYVLEEYVIKLRNLTTDADVTGNFKTPLNTTSFDASTDVDAGTDVFTITGHGFINGEGVIYSDNGNTVIPGLIDGTLYYIDVLTTDTFKLFFDEGLLFPVDITGTSTGTHQLLTNVEEFFISRRTDLHDIYQELVTEAGSFAFQPGDQILGTTGSETNTAYVYSYDDGTDTLVVSIEETNGSRVLFDNTSTITDIAGASVSIAVNSATSRDDLRTATVFVDSTIPASQMQNLSNANGLGVRLHRPSIVNAASHVWEYVGTGTDASALDKLKGDLDDPSFVSREDLPGRVYSVGTDETGDFKAGDFFIVQNRSGKVFFNNIVEINELNLVELTLSDVTINQISTDTGLGDNEPSGAQDSRLSTQRAIRSFIANRLNPVLDKAVSESALPLALVQLNAQGQINADLLPPGRGLSSFPVSGFEERLNLSNEIPAISVSTGDQVSETYEQQVLELTGTVSLAKGSEIIQQNTGATGYAKTDLSSETTLTLVGPFTGTFNTTDELEDDGVSLGANSVPTSIGSRDTITDNYFLSTDNESQFLRLDPNVTYDFTGITIVDSATNEAEGTITSGPITGVVGAVDTLVGGSGYTPGSGSQTYGFVSLTGGTGTGAIADITVTDGAVSAIDMRRGGSGYVVNDTLSANAADIGGTGSGFSVDVATRQTRLYVDLNPPKIKFEATPTNRDYIEDANSPTNSIADLAASATLAFDAEDVGNAGDVDYSANQITITGHGFINGDAVQYDDNGNGTITGLVVGNSYIVGVVDANTIELYTDYSLASGVQVTFSLPEATGVHNITQYTVSLNTNRINIIGHGYTTGDAIRFEATDPPSPIEDGEHFFVGSVTADSFTLHTVRSDALASTGGTTINAVAFADRGTGSATLTTNNVQVIGVVNTSSTNPDNWNVISQQTIDATNIVSGIIAPSRLATGGATEDTFLRGDNTWQVAVQTLATPEPSPLNLSGDFFDDGGVNRYYDTITISIDQVEPGANPTYTTKGVASFNKGQFTVSNGQVAVTSNVINAGTLNGNNGAFYLNPLNLSATVPVSKGGTGLTTYSQGDLLISGATNSLTQLGIGPNNTVLTSNGTQPTWSSSMALAGTLAVAGTVRVDDVTESTSTTTGALQVDGGVGIVKNANVGGALAVTGTTTIGGATTINGIATVNAASNLNGNVVIDNGVSTSVTIQSDDTGTSDLIVIGNLEGTGRVFVGEDANQGGGIEYNGDNAPLTSNAGANYLALYRRTSGNNEWTARNLDTSNDWAFRGQLFSNTSQRVYADDYHPNADTWTTPRTLTLTGAVTGNVSIDGSGNVSLATTATSDPTLTLSGDATGTATFTNLGNATLNVSIDGGNAQTLDNLDSTAFTLDQVTTFGNTTTNAISVGDITTNGFLRGPSSFIIDPSPYNDIGGTVVIRGDLQVDGTTTTINSTSLNVDDINVQLATGSTNAGSADGAGIDVDLGTDGLATMRYNSASDIWTFNKNLQTNTFIGALSGNADTASRWQTARTLTLTGAVTGNVSIDGTGNVSLATTATSDPTLTLSGDATGTATFTNLGNATLNVSIDGGNAQTLDNLDSTAFTLDQVTTFGATTANAVTLGNITTTGYLRGPTTFTIDPSPYNDIGGTVVIRGNLQIDGTTTTINSTSLTVDDLNIELASGSSSAAAANGAGITVDLGTDGTATLTYVSSTDRWTFNKNVQASTFVGALSGNATTASRWQTARTLTLTGAVTGNASIDGSGNVSLATSASPTLTLNGDVTGTATFTNLGNATLTAVVGDNSHNHTTLSGITSLNFAANATDTVSLSTTISSGTTYFDSNLSDDTGQDQWRWRFTPSGQSVYNAMTLSGMTASTARLDVSGEVKTPQVNIQDLTRASAASVQTSSTTQTVLFTFPVAYGAAKVALNATQGNFRHISELLIVHNGTTASATEYGVVNTDGELFTAEVDILSGNVRVLVTTNTTSLTTYTASYTLLV